MNEEITKKNAKTATLITTSGRKKEWTHGVVNPPVYRASTCIFDTYAEMQARLNNVGKERKLFYGRKGTPTLWALEEAMTTLEGGHGTQLFPSGVAAVNSSILACVKAGDHVLITDNAYDPTRSFAKNFLKKMGVEHTFFDPMVGADIKNLFQPNTTCILAETPGSLTFEVSDVRAIAAAAATKKDVFTIVDNTWASPLFLNPLSLGADISVHAATKYIGGHSDVMLGTATANERTFNRLQSTAFMMGQTASPDDATLGLRGLRTLGVRLKTHEENGLKVARWLQSQPQVARVLHPALPNCPGHTVWKRDFKGASGLFSIVLKGGTRDDTAKLVDGRKYFKMGFSWGGYESLILPTSPEQNRDATFWESEGPVVRLHIGLEDPEDLMDDLRDGLNAYSKHMGW